MPNYNVMGVAKAALEASVRYLAVDFGPQQHPRQRHLGRADPHARRRRHRRRAPDVRVPAAPFAARPRRDARRDRRRRRSICSPICRPASPAKSTSSIPATTSSPCRSPPRSRTRPPPTRRRSPRTRRSKTAAAITVKTSAEPPVPQGVSGAAIACSGHLRVRPADRLAGSGPSAAGTGSCAARARIGRRCCRNGQLESRFRRERSHANEIGLRSGCRLDAAG